MHAWPLEKGIGNGGGGGMLLHDLCFEKAEVTLSMFLKDRKKFLIGINSVKLGYICLEQLGSYIYYFDYLAISRSSFLIP